MKYPSDNFYSTHSLHLDFNRTGKDEFQIMVNELKKIGITSTPKATLSSLDILQLIHTFVLKHGKDEQKIYFNYLHKNQITGNIIPADASLAHDVFQFLMNNIDPYYTAALLLLGLKNSILSMIKKINSKNSLDIQTKKIVEKIIYDDKENVIIKKIIEIHIKYKQPKKNNKKYKNSKNTKK